MLTVLKSNDYIRLYLSINACCRLYLVIFPVPYDCTGLYVALLDSVLALDGFLRGRFRELSTICSMVFLTSSGIWLVSNFMLLGGIRLPSIKKISSTFAHVPRGTDFAPSGLYSFMIKLCNEYFPPVQSIKSLSDGWQFPSLSPKM